MARLSSAASACLAASRPAPELSYGERMPLSQLRRAVAAAPSVAVAVCFDGEHLVTVPVPKRAILSAIRRMRKFGRTVRADDCFGQLLIG